MPLKLQLSWRRGPAMSSSMGVPVQSIVVQGTVYVGGSGFDGDKVMEYDTSSGKWAKLPQRTCGFAMTVINNQLVLVGGWEHGRMLSVWRAESKEWTHPYPEMPTARSDSSVVTNKEWLAVAGGLIDGEAVSSVEVMNTDSKQWYAGPPTPTPWDSMKTAIVGDTCYFMGGTTGGSFFPTAKVYSVSLPALISQLHSQDSRERGKQHQIWKEISGLQTTHSAPLSISGSLLAVGGKDKDDHAVTAIHLYQPNTEEWVKVGDLPTPRYDGTCAMSTDRELLVAGGYHDSAREKKSDIGDIALINTQ
jgi:N-acetylneuraminic acid mutarotase